NNPSTASRTVTFQVDDGPPTNHASNVVTRDLTGISVNSAPVLADIETTALSYTENGSALALTATPTLPDSDSANLTGATVQITGNCANPEDVLSFSTQNGISGVYTPASCLLTLSGSSLVANYQTALHSVTYSNSSDNPSTATRTVTFQVDDGQP